MRDPCRCVAQVYNRVVGSLERVVIEVVDSDVATLLRLKSPAERLEMGFALWRSARDMLTAMLTRQHPGWTDEEVVSEVARRLSHAAR